MEQSIFISYSRKDLKHAKRIKGEIENSTSIRCWMDMDGIESGSQFEETIISAIDNACVVVFLLSENSMKSRWAKDEIRYAFEIGKRIVPVNIDDCTPRGWFLFRLSGLDVISYSNKDQKVKLMENLALWSNADVSSRHVEPDENPKLFFTISLVMQFVLFGGLLVLFASMFFFGLLTMQEGIWASRYNLLLCACLCGTLYFTYQLSKYDKRAFSVLCLLDIVEIILICAIAQRINAYAVWKNHTFHTLPYLYLDGLGCEIRNKGFVIIAFLMEFFALVHIAAMAAVLFVKVKGQRIWDKMK